MIRFLTRIKSIREYAKPKKGFYIHFDGSWEWIFVGEEKPQLQEGDIVSIIIAKEATNVKETSPSDNRTAEHS